MEQKQVKEIIGRLEKFGKAISQKSNKEFYEVVVDNKMHRWWNITDGDAAFESLNVGDTVRLTYEESPNELNPNAPYKNVKSMFREGTVQSPSQQPQSTQHTKLNGDYNFNPFFGMILNQSISVVIAKYRKGEIENITTKEVDDVFNILWHYAVKKRELKQNGQER